jgi:hypothetical protein
MKLNLVCLLLGAAMLGMVNGCRTTTETGAAPLELFNGKNLDAWKFVLTDPKATKESVWSVRDGMIICKGDPIGFIYAGGKLRNFKLVVEYRWAPGAKPGNSGIFSRIHEPLKPIPACAEVQLQHGSAGDVMTLQGMSMGQAQPRFFSVSQHKVAGDICGVKKTMDKEKPPGEWNRVEILADEDRYTVWMNGEKINEVTGVEVCAGPIGLQSEGGEVHFRKATLTPR